MKDYKEELNYIDLINKCAELTSEKIQAVEENKIFHETMLSNVWARNTLPEGFTDKIFYKNMQTERLSFEGSPVTPEYLNTKITYSFNNNGFRLYSSYIPERTQSLYAFGCSYTFGVSLPEEHTWPYILANKLGKWNVKNYGMGGGGISTIARVCYQVITTLQGNELPDLVVVFLPTIFRMEYAGNVDNVLYYKRLYKASYEEHPTINSDRYGKERSFFNYSSSMHCFFDAVTSFILLKETLKSKNIKWFWYTWDHPLYKLDKELISMFLDDNSSFVNNKLEKIQISKDKARDGTHAGLPYMTNIANLFYNLCKNN